MTSPVRAPEPPAAKRMADGDGLSVRAPSRRRRDSTREASALDPCPCIHRVNFAASGLDAFIADEMDNAALVDEPRPCLEELRRAVGITSSVQGQGAGLDDHEARPWVECQPNVPPGAILLSRSAASPSSA